MHAAPPFLIAAGVFSAVALAQQTPVRAPGATEVAPPVLTAVSPGVWRTAGTDAWSGVRYVRVFTTAGETAAKSPDLTRATLTGQCTQDAQGKLRFELFANFGGVPDATFYPPWHGTETETFPPRTTRVTLTLEFLGYTKVKPFKRQFEQVLAPGPDQLRYVNPGVESSNMEPPGWFFQYMRALPTLRLSEPGHVAEFATTNWLQALHGEPLCAASGA